MDKRYTDDQLYDYCMEETTITCSRCQKTDTEQADADIATQAFFTSGWRATKKNCYCPDCTKKHIKSI